MKALIECSLGDIGIEVLAAKELHDDLSIFYHKMEAFKTNAPTDLRLFILKPKLSVKDPAADTGQEFIEHLIQRALQATAAVQNHYNWPRARQRLRVWFSNPEVKRFLASLVAICGKLAFMPLTCGFLFADPVVKAAVLLLDEDWPAQNALPYPSKQPLMNVAVVNAVMAFLAFYLAENGDGLIAHGTGVSIANKGYLFLAPSGGGKTAFSMASPAGSVLADDGIIVRRGRDGYRLYPTPLRQRLGGEFNTWVWHPTPVMLQALFFLTKSLETRITPISSFQTMGFLMNALTHFFMWMQPNQKIAVLDFWRHLVATVHLAQLEWRLDSEHWLMINDFMNRGNKNETQKRNSRVAWGL